MSVDDKVNLSYHHSWKKACVLETLCLEETDSMHYSTFRCHLRVYPGNTALSISLLACRYGKKLVMHQDKAIAIQIILISVAYRHTCLHTKTNTRLKTNWNTSCVILFFHEKIAYTHMNCKNSNDSNFTFAGFYMHLSKSERGDDSICMLR